MTKMVAINADLKRRAKLVAAAQKIKLTEFIVEALSLKNQKKEETEKEYVKIDTLPPELYEEAKAAARASGMTIARYIEDALEENCKRMTVHQLYKQIAGKK